MIVRHFTPLVLVLLSIEFLDELVSGVPGAGAHEIQQGFVVSHTSMGALITAFGLLALWVEPPLFFLADRYPRRWFVCGGMLALGASCLMAAAAPSYWWLFAALLLFGPASGMGVGLSQATLIDADPGHTERWLTRWTLAGEVGDLATPALVAVMITLGWGWRGAFAACGVLAISQGVALWFQEFPDDAFARNVSEDSGAATETTREAGREDEEPNWRQAIGLALSNRALLLWSLALVACALLDEILVVFGVLHMTRDLGFSEPRALLVIAAMSAGGIAGLVASEALHDRFPPLRLLVATCIFTLAALFGFVYSTRLLTLVIWGLLLGLGIALQYPLAKAQLYRTIPGQTGTALAVAGLFGPIDLALPIAVGFVADRAGLVAALLVLGLQPVVLLVVAWIAVERAPAGS